MIEVRAHLKRLQREEYLRKEKKEEEKREKEKREKLMKQQTEAKISMEN